ncbi:DUF2892 domain-containing protein [Candidatus Woesearchaeota archaeon]|nr:DUF2892 domain-containing protein [Candidatus Woesearchaeota archaeon]
MEKNIGKTDKIIRAIAAIIFIVLGHIYTPWFYIIPALLLFTILTGSCLPYKILGINTAKKEK